MNDNLLIYGLVLGLSAGMSPGPMLTLVISETMQHGTRSGVKVALAPLISDAPIILGAVWLLSQLSDISGILGVISFVGGLLLFYLGLDSLRFKGVALSTVPAESRSLQKGVMANLLNPNPYLFWVTIGGPLLLKSLWVDFWTVVMFLIGFYICLIGSKIVIALVTGKTKIFMQSNLYVWIIKGLGVALIVFALFFIRDAIRYFGFIA